MPGVAFIISKSACVAELHTPPRGAASASGAFGGVGHILVGLQAR